MQCRLDCCLGHDWWLWTSVYLAGANTCSKPLMYGLLGKTARLLHEPIIIHTLRMYGNRSVVCTRAARFLQDWLIAPRGIFVPQDGEGCRASYRHLHLWLGWSSAICWQTEMEPYIWGHADPPQHACERYGCLLSWRRVQSFFIVADTRLSTVSGLNYK